ncbi:hypothetical protein EVG20_g9083 [Dentipellis fragilis]|uniref:F-box domain-containing protein n=1 Tax=Dentipellis fragilis TaxID=205917 RepID=A0A4Y9Y296_9AGAM|nr:hypothetical protein EVG20_g9083 [Dentipellis fragilis]
MRMHEAELSAWQSCHSTTSPVASLPPEILTAIFLYVTEIDAPRANTYPGGRHRKSLGWIKITHVCPRWRQIALGTPLLWRNIVLRAGGTETMLQRAAGVLLRVNVATNPRKFRTQLAPLQKPTSRLQVLSLVMMGGWRNGRRSMALVPHTWLCNAQDSMRELSLDFVYCDWGRLRFPAMVSLKLSYLGLRHQRAAMKHLPTVSMLASALATMPNLQILDLCNAVSPRSLPKDSTDPFIRTPLPNLSTFNIDMDMRLCTLLLRHLAIPHEADIVIISRDDEPDIQSLAAQLDELQDYLVAYPAHAAPAFHLTIAYRAWRAEVHAQGSVAGSFHGIFDSDAEGMTILLGKLPLADADHLELGPFGFHRDNLPNWNQIFGSINLKLRRARTVTINLETSSEVLLALLERGPQMMPLLKTLVIRIDFIDQMPDRDLFRARLDELSSVETIEVHTYALSLEEKMEDYMDGVRPEVRYVTLNWNV